MLRTLEPRFDVAYSPNPAVTVSPQEDVTPAKRHGFIGLTYPLGSNLIIKSFERLRSDNDKSRDWKDCDHYKRDCDPFGSRPPVFSWTTRTTDDIGHWTGPATTGWIPWTLPGFTDSDLGPNPLIETREDGSFAPYPLALDDLCSEAISRMLPHIKSELSSVNSIIELKDFASLPHTLGNIGQLALRSVRSLKPTNLPSWMSSIRARFRNAPTLRELLRGGADGYLQTQFNILPLLSDIAGIRKAMERNFRVMNNLVSRSGKRRISHFVKDVDPGPLKGFAESTELGAWVDSNTYPGEPGTAVYGGHVLGFKTLYTYLSRGTFHAQMEYNYHFDAYQRHHAQFLTFMDSIGWNYNPAIIWNAIPWSFVVDWVFGVSRWLDQHKRLNMEPQINITRFLWSYKVTRTQTATLMSYQSEGLFCPPILPIHLPDVSESAYCRRVSLVPVKSHPLVTSGLSLREISLGLSLLLSRGEGRKRL